MKKQNIVVMTDPDKDQDDLLCLIMLCNLQKAGAATCKGVITTHGDAHIVFKRAKYVSGILKYLNTDMPICAGRGKSNDHYSEKIFFVNDDVKRILELADKTKIARNSKIFLKNIFENAEPNSIDILIIADMTDIADFIKQNSALFLKKIRTVNIMGGIILAQGINFLTPDGCTNNSHDMPAAQHLYSFLRANKIPTVIINHSAAAAVAVSPAFYENFRQKDNLVINHAIEFWKYQFEGLNLVTLKGHNAKKHSIEWLLKTFTDIPESDYPKIKAMPKNRKTARMITEHTVRINWYDPLTLIAALDINKKYFTQEKHENFTLMYPKNKDKIYDLFVEYMKG